ncbi:MAG: LCP family protein [Candidatus Moraniibacteriota bacterium]
MDSLRKPASPASPAPPRREFSLGSSENLSSERLPQKKSVPLISERPSPRRYFPLSLLIVFLFLIGIGGSLYFLAGITLTRSIHFENRELSFFESMRAVGQSLFQKSAPLKGETAGRVNILLLGRAGEHYPGKNLTDSVMIMSLDTKGKRVALLSLPRDLFAPIPGTGTSTKINSLYQIGLSNNAGADIIKKSVEFMTGLPIQYSAVIDFDGFEKVVDALGGISVDVVRDFHDPRYPGKNYSYETFDITAGWQRLDGATALKYARERHNDPEGDFGRAKRQQQILQAMRERALSFPVFLNPFTLHNFLSSLGKSITTDIAPEELKRFIEIGQSYDTQNVSTSVVDAWKKESLLRVSHIDTPSGPAFILVPRSGSWDEVRLLAENLFDAEHEREMRAKIQGEKSSLKILATGKSASAAEMLRQSLQSEFELKEVTLTVLPSLEKIGETAMIQDKTGLAKPFTLDALLRRYNLEKTESLPENTTASSQNSDFVILFTRTSFDDETLPPGEDALTNYDFQEPLPPQPTRER